MSVGSDPITCYEGEDVQWEFTVTDPNIASIVGQTIALTIKQLPTSPNPSLITAACTNTATLKCKAQPNIALAAGAYFYSVDRTDASSATKYAQGPLTVLKSVPYGP